MANNVATKEKRPVREQGDQRERQAWLQPYVNIVETKDAYVLEAEMPGVSKEGLEVLLEGNELTIVGTRKYGVEGAELVYRESQDRGFRRTFELDPTIDTQGISARMENGVLHLELRKAEKVKPRRITVE
jgi:HSP20 family protein